MTRVSSHIRVVALAACLGAVLAPARSFAQRADSSTEAAARTYNVGIVRADGVLIPFAQFDQGTWRPFWTGVSHSFSPEIPLTLRDVDRDWWRREPPALDWTLWRAEGPLALKASAPRVVSTPCSTEVGLATDLKPAGILPPPHQVPYPKAGLATTALVQFESIAEVLRNDTDWMRVQRALEDQEFRNAENRALADMHWNHPVEPRLRDRAPIDLQAVWHVKDSRFFYFEAMRRYPDRNPPKGKPPCELVTYVAGYFWEAPSERLRPVSVSALISYCHMERASFLWPLGVIRESARQFWVFQSAGWTGEVYGITELVPSKGFIRPQLWHVAGRCR